MLFKYAMYSPVGEDTWVVVDGFDEINWQQGWLTMLEGSDPEAPGKITTFGFSDKDPDTYEEGECRGLCIPDEIYVPDEWYKSLMGKKTNKIAVIYVALRKHRDATRMMLVNHAYLLNDDGRTVERLYPKV